MNQLKIDKKLIAMVAIGLIVGLFLSFLSITESNCTRIGTGCYELEKAQEESSRIRGLSGRTSLGESQGMLFVFDHKGEQCVWMKDMKFSLDMIWLDEAGRVVKLKESVSPDTYPMSFCSDTEAKYVVELNAEEVSSSGLKLGDRVMIN